MSNSKVARIVGNSESIKEHVKQTHSDVYKRALRSCAERAAQRARARLLDGRGSCCDPNAACAQQLRRAQSLFSAP